MLKRNYHGWIEIALMLAVSAAIYLPFIAQFGYYNDDWYSMYAARVAGPQVFHEIYGLDRPGRAYVMIPLYQLFQGNPLYYNISAYVFRVLGAICLLWLLRLVWRERRNETFLIALLFLIYPGFLSMPNGIDFQSHLIALCLVFLSIGMSILTLSNTGVKKKFLFWAGAVFTGWAYLSQMEYYLGFEAARLFLLAVLAWRDHSAWKKKLLHTVYAWLPFSPVPVFFLIWRLFFFASERVATDVDLQFGPLISAPLATLYNWIGSFIQSFLNVTLFAWGTPLHQLAFPLGTSASIRGITLGVVVALVSTAVFVLLGNISRSLENEENNDSWRYEMLFVGVLWAVAGLVIVILANRSVIFPAYSRYGMVSAAGAIILLVSGLSFLSEKRVQMALISFLLFSSAFTHYANGLQHAQIAQSMRMFWWQVSWRVPQFVQGATVIVNYPSSGNREDSFIWGPANHIYYPYQIKEGRVNAGISAILLDHDAVIKILTGAEPLYRKRIIVSTYRNYRNFVILTQPTSGSCVQVIDGTNPEYSAYEIDPILLIGSHSETGLIELSEKFITPPQFLFNTEPSHTWCYYYEKAAYERQLGNWEAVLQLGEQAFAQGFAPMDEIEWMPFLQAYAQTGNIDGLQEIRQQMKKADPFVFQQVCKILASIPDLPESVTETINSLYCAKN